MPYHGTKRLMTSWFPKLIMVFVFRPIISSLSHYMLMTCFWWVTIYFLLIHIKLYYPMPWNDKTQRSIMVIRYHNKEGLKQESVDHVTIIFHKKDLEQFSMSNSRGGHYMCKLGTTCVQRVFYGGLLSTYFWIYQTITLEKKRFQDHFLDLILLVKTEADSLFAPYITYMNLRKTAIPVEDKEHC